MDRETDNIQKNTVRAAGSSAVKACLAVLFLLGAVMTFLGFRGKAVFDGSGFSTENSFYSVWQLSRDTDSVWKDCISPALESLSAEERDAAERAAGDALSAEAGA